MSSKKVIVGVNPSFDSIAALILLKLQNFDLTAIHVVTKGYDPEGLVNSGGIDCLNKTNESLLNQILSILDIPLFYVDQKEIFYDHVVGHNVIANFMKEGHYPCLDCHKIRIMALYEKMIKLKADHIATGHFAKLRKGTQEGQVNLYQNTISALDQHLYLSGVDQTILSHLILPLSDLNKEKVISIVKQHLPKHHHLLSNSNEKHKCNILSNMSTTIKKKIAPSLCKKARLFIRENNTFMHEAYDNTEFDFGKQFKMGRDKQGKEQILEVTGYNYSYQTIYVSDLATKKDANFFYVQIIENFGRPQFFTPLECHISIEEDKIQIPATIYHKAINYLLVSLKDSFHPFVPSKTLIFISEQNKLGNRLLYLGRIIAQGFHEKSTELIPISLSKTEGDFPF